MRFLYFMIIAVSVLLTSCGQGVNTSGTASEKKVHPWLVYEEGVTFDDIYLVKDMIGSLSIFGEPPRSFLDECHRHNIEVYKAVAGKTESIDTQEERDALYESYVNYCENGYDGIDFDFEGIDAGMQEVYSEFLKKTASRLHQMGKKVSHCVGFYPNMYEDENALMFYDPEVLNEVCDLVRIMCYDMYWAPGNAGGEKRSVVEASSQRACLNLTTQFTRFALRGSFGAFHPSHAAFASFPCFSRILRNLDSHSFAAIACRFCQPWRRRSFAEILGKRFLAVP